MFSPKQAMGAILCLVRAAHGRKVMRKIESIVFVLLAAIIGAGPVTPPTGAPDEHADSSKPQSPAAVAAMKDYEKSCKAAEDACSQAKCAAAKKLLEKLKVALNVSTKNSNLKEANLIDGEIKAVQQSIAELSIPASEAKTVIVYGQKEWQQAAQVRAGQLIRIRAAGKWCWNTSTRQSSTGGPDGITECGWLQARVGDAAPVKIGSHGEFTAPFDGVLQLEMSDSSHADNDGCVTAQVTIVNVR
jgi:hypothetical protein